jgi:hypothetical protein
MELMANSQGSSEREEIRTARMIRLPWLAILLAVGSSCTSPQEHTESSALSDLVERPEDYSGQEVEVSGFMLVSWEGGGLFRTKNDEESFNTGTAIRLLIPTKELGPLEQYDGTFGTITGAFESDQSHGWRGTIRVSKISPVSRFRPAIRPRERPDSGNAEELLLEQVHRTLQESASERKPK